MSLKNYDYFFKILMIGDSCVGKSSILLYFCDKRFNDNLLATIGCDLKIKEIRIDGKIVKLEIVRINIIIFFNQQDTSGIERFRNMIKNYYRGVHGIIIVYDITDEGSFEHIKDWLKDINIYNNNAIKLIIGNKSDLSEKREVTEEDRKFLEEQTGIDIIETSAKN